MIVCVCRRLSDRDIRARVLAGAASPAEVFSACGTAPNCGSCVGDMHELISEFRGDARAALADAAD
jgi:bacterioferritin-associated ferredoxin